MSFAEFSPLEQQVDEEKTETHVYNSMKEIEKVG